MPARAMRRRWLLAGVPTLVLASVPARAAGGDLVVTCDTTLAPALREVADAYKARVGGHMFIFATGPGLILPQLVRDIQNDIVVTQTAILEQAAQAGVIAAPVRAQWRNPLVIAGRAGAATTDGAFAATDPSPASDIDGPALLARLAIKPARTLSAVDTDEVAFLLTTGAAQAGLLHMTDVRADARLAAIRPVPAEAQSPPLYAAAVTRLARRPNPEEFVAFLTTREAGDILAAAGLEAII
jgi:molybdate transport system substrate-binding protein